MFIIFSSRGIKNANIENQLGGGGGGGGGGG